MYKHNKCNKNTYMRLYCQMSNFNWFGFMVFNATFNNV